MTDPFWTMGHFPSRGGDQIRVVHTPAGTYAFAHDPDPEGGYRALRFDGMVDVDRYEHPEPASRLGPFSSLESAWRGMERSFANLTGMAVKPCSGGLEPYEILPARS